MPTPLNSSSDLALKPGSLILVTGATGYIATHIINEALTYGYKVRGTVRSKSKGEDTVKIFRDANPENYQNYEPFVVEDMSPPNAFDEAVKGVDGVIHTASVVNFSPDPNEVVQPVVEAAVNIMKSCVKEPNGSVKRFVYTSSSTAASEPRPNIKWDMTKDTWNDESAKIAWAPPPYKEDRAFSVYAASKAAAERAVWKFVEDEKPGFVVNTILPNANFGRILKGSAGGATGTIIPELYKNGTVADWLPPQWMIDVIDDGRIHLAALIDSSIMNERIYAFDSPFNWNDLIDVIQKIRPNAKLPEKNEKLGKDITDVDNKLGRELLKKWFGASGYKGLEQSATENLENID